MSAVPHSQPVPYDAAKVARQSAGLGRQPLEGRALHLIDLENLVGDPDAPRDEIERVWRTYRGGISSTAGDQFVVGSSSHFARTAWFVLGSGVQRLNRDGTDGGELALIESVDLEYAATRFRRLVIGSGDGEFTDFAQRAQDLGLHVHQVVGRGRPSWRLHRAVNSHSRLRLSPREMASA